MGSEQCSEEVLDQLIRIVGHVEIDRCAAWFVSMKHTERRGVNMDGDEILATHVTIHVSAPTLASFVPTGLKISR